MRHGIQQGWGQLKPMDAIHLATAQQMAVAEFHTYCERLHKWDKAPRLPRDRASDSRRRFLG